MKAKFKSRKPAPKTKTAVYAAPVRWTYSRYRAMLRLDGKPFAIVTPDGKNAVSHEAEKQLLGALNGPTSMITITWNSRVAKKKKNK